MTVQIGVTWICAVLLCSMRLGGVLLLTPLLNGFGIPARIKVMLTLTLSAMLVATLPTLPAAPSLVGGALLGACISELVTGAVLGFGVLTALAAVSFAGKILDIQSGFGLANVFDPITRSQSPLIGALFGLLALVMFFTADAHHALLRGLAYSLSRLPLGRALEMPVPQLLAHQFGIVFSLGLVLAAPVVFLLFLIEASLAIIARNLPQMNLMMIGAPVKIAAALLALAALSPQLSPVFGRLYAAIFSFWERLL